MADQVFKKDTAWGNSNNFIGESEITVTITLAEYRELVRADGAWDKKYSELAGKNRELVERVSELQKKIDSYKEIFKSEEEE